MVGKSQVLVSSGFMDRIFEVEKTALVVLCIHCDVLLTSVGVSYEYTGVVSPTVLPATRRRRHRAYSRFSEFFG